VSDEGRQPGDAPWEREGPDAPDTGDDVDDPARRGEADPPSWYPYSTANTAYPIDLTWPTPPRQPRRPGRAAAVVAAVLLCVAALGAPLGLLWAAVAPTVQVRMTSDGALLADQQPEEFIAADGWFTLLGCCFGVLAAVVVWFVVRRRGPLPLVAVTLGAVGAGLIAWWLGRHQGLDAYQRLLESAPDGTVFGKPADLRAADFDLRYGFLPVIRGNVLVPALAAAVTYALLAGWSRFPSLRQGEDDPFDATGPGGAFGFAGPPPAGAFEPPVSWDSTETPAHPAAQARPAPGEAATPPG
jgi:hypothetical protein